MAFKSSDSQNSEGRHRGGKDQKKKMKKMRSIKLPKLSSLNSSSRRATWQFNLSAIDLAIDELNSMESSDSKKENFELETESEDTSASSSGNSKSRLDQTPLELLNASPDNSKPKCRSEGKIATNNFTRTPSMRSVRILKSKASFKSRRPLVKKRTEAAKDLNIERATCSSTLKDSKFSKEIELHEGENEVEKISVMKVCPYHHCSLNGHCHGPEPVEKKPFLRRKNRSSKTQKSKWREDKEKDAREILFGEKSQSGKIFQENDFVAETEPRAMSSTGESQENGDGDAGEILFGGKSRSRKISQEIEDGNAGEIMFGRKSQSGKILQENDLAVETGPRAISSTGESQENGDGDVGGILFGAKSRSRKFFQENENGNAGEILFGGKSQPEKSSLENDDEDAGKNLLGGKSLSAKNFQENLNQTDNFLEPRLKKENSISMWHLIHRQMVSGLQEEDEENKKKSLSRNISDADVGNEESEIRKIFAIKLVREAIEKILLPEVQDQSSDDQSVTSDVNSKQENLEGSISISTDYAKQEKAQANDDNGEEKKGESEKTAPKSWSYLKKVILLKRFVKELQKVREFSPRKPQSRPLDRGKEAEKVSLRPQMTSEKRNSEEWMLDYAIRQVVSELALNQKRKVALLVKAFETVAPNQEDQPTKVNVHKVKGNNQDFESNEVDNVVLSSNFDSSEQITETHEGNNREFKLEGVKEENGVVSSSLNGNVFEEINAKIEEKKGDSNEEHESVNGSTEIKDSEDITEENGAISSSSNCHVLEEIDAEMEEKKGSKEECESISGSTPMADSKDVTEENGDVSSSSNCDVFEEINSKMEEKKGISKEDCESNIGSTPRKDSEDNGFGHRAFKLRVKRENHISMWHLIHEQMVSGLAAESGTESLCGADEKQVDDVSTTFANKDNESEETEMRKIFAIKLVREAIEKILLPEVQDQSSDDQSITSDVTSEQDLNKKNRNEDFEKLKANSMEDDRSIDPKEESCEDNNEEDKTERKEGSKSEKQKPKSWSYLKKVILLKRFVKELEKVKKFNPRKPNFLPLEPDQEAEKVSLRPPTVGEKRNTDEWMLDYAIRQVVSQLAPTQKRKVALLVKAFETVAPPNEDHSNIREGGSKSSGKFAGLDDLRDVESKVNEDFVSSSNCQPKEEVNEEQEVKSRGSDPEILVMKTDKMMVEKQNHIKMWHMIYQHVVSGIAEKVGPELLIDGGDEDERVENVMNLRKYEAGDEEFEEKSQRLKFSKSDAVKLVQEAVNEILDDSSDTQSTSGDNITTQEDSHSPAGDIIIPQEEEKERVIVRNEKQKSKNWSKLKNLILLKRSIKALANVKKRDPQPSKKLAVKDDVEKEKVDLRSQMVDERKKAEQWMLDYAVQHIVTKLTPARKRRVAMLVEAFEAVVPLPES